MHTNQTIANDKSLMNTGVVVSVRGSVVDIVFDEHLPPINSLLHAREPGIKRSTFHGFFVALPVSAPTNIVANI